MDNPSVQVKDNFLNEKELKIILSNLNKINFTYRPKDGEDKTDGFRHVFTPAEDSKWLFEKIKNQFFPDKDLKSALCAYHLRWNKHKKLLHCDENDDFNFILYLKGKELLFNGTGFFKDQKLHTAIGFMYNRAIFFNGKNVLHSDLQAFGDSSFRSTLNIFFRYK